MFSCFFGSKIFCFPEAPPGRYFHWFFGFWNFGPKNAQKHSETRGANSVARIPSSFSMGIYSFFGAKNCLSWADRVLAPKGVGSRNPLFSSVFPPQTVLQAHSLTKKAVTKFPLLKGSQTGASQRKTVQSTRSTVSQRKHKKNNNTEKTLEQQSHNASTRRTTTLKKLLKQKNQEPKQKQNKKNKKTK